MHPINYFNRWFSQPIVVTDYAVVGIITALNQHSMAQDATAQDYVMPLRRCCEKSGRFRVLGENQDTFYCFVYADDEQKLDPPIYFETCLDLAIDYGFDTADIIDGDHVLVCSTFTPFLWQILGRHVCIRLESGNQFTGGVSGIIWKEAIALDSAFTNPMGKDFPAGYICFFSEDTVCIPDWGAAFLHDEARRLFIEQYKPVIHQSWD
ncbi:MAG: hypothetical protein AAGF95_16640 [Chloroflexota bacterium]